MHFCTEFYAKYQVIQHLDIIIRDVYIIVRVQNEILAEGSSALSKLQSLQRPVWRLVHLIMIARCQSSVRR